ncbi:MAG: twin-arginine translocase TatA/TatE family subunit [Acidipropionibacterium acidipropionici]|uniref:twin-arginine translocase TatA/TatE family subunit n=1 Tax=Acidipropionibacterium TaxID=1912215 RepID=UPI000BA9F2AB|nr:twin-arginine translocase TatA/TatE family subunit [Acidipropionibacterium acidipropionici]AZP39468.1 twin-arginine translocase TatA/TatE family subunit [Acidipropionibacterium acidipropionici]QCV96772.1 twin-arginine translocase TatA/TatE family subunit [Acidipropionibacterium acidipropionici]
MQLMLIPTEMGILILVIVALVLFGGSRIAGVGKGAGRAIREFKEETAGLKEVDKKKAEDAAKAESEDKTETEAKPSE